MPDDDTVARIEAIPDPGRRLRAATEQMAVSQRNVVELGRLRKSLIKQLRRDGQTFSQIGEAAGLTRGRIHQILQAGPPAEGRFFGQSPVTVAFPLRALPGRDEEPVISAEDSRAVESLSRLLAELAFEVQRFPIPVDGRWEPASPSTVAICGPKSSPVTARAIAADPFLSFEPDDQGVWLIRDRASGIAYVSPIDRPGRSRSADVAYIGRLRVNRRIVLFVAGVHSLGSVGAVQYLVDNLEELYEAVGNRPFSMVVTSRHRGATVTNTEAACPPRIHPSA